MVDEVTETLNGVSDGYEHHRYDPQPGLREFIADMTTAICQTEHCEYKMSACTHGRLASELMKAMQDYYAGVFDRKGNKEVADFLRSEM